MEIWLVILFLSRKKFHAKQIFVLRSFLKLCPDAAVIILCSIVQSCSLVCQICPEFPAFTWYRATEAHFGCRTHCVPCPISALRSFTHYSRFVFVESDLAIQ